MDIKIGVFNAADYGGVFFLRLKPLQSKKKKTIFQHFWGDKSIFIKIYMGIKIWVFDGAEYAGVVEFELKPLPSEKISIIDVFGEKIGERNSQKM